MRKEPERDSAIILRPIEISLSQQEADRVWDMLKEKRTAEINDTPRKSRVAKMLEEGWVPVSIQEDDLRDPQGEKDIVARMMSSHMELYMHPLDIRVTPDEADLLYKHMKRKGNTGMPFKSDDMKTLRELLDESGFNWARCRIAYKNKEISSNDDVLDVKFDTGYGSADSPGPFIAFDDKFMYSVAEYDGSEWMESAGYRFEDYLEVEQL